MCDEAKFIKAEAVRSRIARECDECGTPIEAGELHEYVFGVWDDPEHYRICAPCHEVRSDLYHTKIDNGAYPEEAACDLVYCGLRDALQDECREVEMSMRSQSA